MAFSAPHLVGAIATGGNKVGNKAIHGANLSGRSSRSTNRRILGRSGQPAIAVAIVDAKVRSDFRMRVLKPGESLSVLRPLFYQGIAVFERPAPPPRSL